MMRVIFPNQPIEPESELGYVPTRLNNAENLLSEQKQLWLPSNYIPTSLDICCGRGKKNWNHQGNAMFRNIIRANVSRYIEAPTKGDKTHVVCSIVEAIRSQGGKFLKEAEKGTWYDIGDIQARDKVGHSLRDQVSNSNKQKVPKTKPIRRSSEVTFSDIDISEIESEYQPLVIRTSLDRDSFVHMASTVPDVVPSFDDTFEDYTRRPSARQFLDNLNNLDQCSDEEALDDFFL